MKTIESATDRKITAFQHKLFVTLALLLFFCAVAHGQTVVYTNNDGSNGTFSGGVTGTVSGGQQSTSPSGEMFRETPLGNSTLTVTINGLTPNSGFSLSLDLYAIQSLDGNGPFGGNSDSNPDLFTITANTATLLNAAFANFPGNSQTYPSMYNPSNVVHNPDDTGATATNTLGYTFNGGPMDATYALSFSGTANSAGTLTLSFIGAQNQAQGDESFGVDNISVSGTVVPEPATWALMLGGMVLLLAVRRRRSRAL